MREKPTPEQVDEVLKSAEALKRVDPEALPAEEKDIPPQFGNNFYLLFKSRTFRNELPADSAIKKIYLNRAEALGEPWQRFVSENAQLLADLDRALIEENIYSKALELFRDFYAARDFDAGDEYDKKIHPELGINAIGIPIWRRLNELLQQAAEAMERIGIDPKQFYG